MVTESVVINVRERGATATAAGIKRVGSSSRKATVAVTALLGALGGFLAIRGLLRIAKDAVKASAAFEQFGIRIAALLGSQKEANIALANFTKLASRTPFAVSQVVEGASALGAAALGNRDALEKLTFQAANLAATTGLSFQEAATNLQRALSAGIGAADLFRDRGVKALIESIAGIPDATKLSTDELRVIFEETFGAGGTFGNQAEALAATLGGSLSNIGDAATNASVALGNAFAPAVIAAARQAIIPFLEKLQVLVEENEGAIRDFGERLIKGAVPALANTARAAFALVVTFKTLFQFVRTAIGIWGQFTLALQESLTAVLRFGNAIGAISDRELAISERDLRTARDSVDAYAAEVGAAGRENEAFERTLDSLNEGLADLERRVEGVDFDVEPPKRKDIELPEGTGDPKKSTEQINATKQIISLTNQLRISSAGRVSQEEAQLERLEQQRQKLIELAKLAGDVTLAREGLLEIEAQIVDIREDQAEEALEESRRAAREIGDLFSNRIGEGIRGAIMGEGFDAMEVLANIGGDLVQKALDDAISAITDTISDVFTNLASSLGAEGGLGGAFGAAFAGAVGVGIGILAAELGGTSAQTRNDLVRSATESAQATRGVVAGPTSIPVFQVGQQLEAALSVTEGILEQILAAIEAQPVAGAAGGETGAAGGSSADLALTTPSLA